MNIYVAKLLRFSLFACGCLFVAAQLDLLLATEKPATTTPINSPLTIADSLANFQLHPDLKIELAA
uniref:hypothetical protein n=1 Tax=Symmachiella dynata TaxID=2527995 RepID=UPI0030EF5073